MAAIGFESSTHVLAAGLECKGLEKSNCEGDERCSWVKSYKTSKGKEVSAFCRKKPERKKTSQTVTSPKS
jgi:hypothetical protein